MKPVCRNLLIHGYCKFEHSGCEFSHGDPQPLDAIPPTDPAPSSAAFSSPQYTSASPEGKKGKLRFDSPEFKPSSISLAVNAPAFVPSALASQLEYDSFELSAYGNDSFDPIYQDFKRTKHNVGFNQDNLVSGLGAMGISSMPSSNSALPSANRQTFDSDRLGFPQTPDPSLNQPLQPIQYHLYAPPLPHTSNIPNHYKTIQYFFMDDKLRETLQRQAEASRQVLDPNSPEGQTLPPEIHGYHSLYPLEDRAMDRQSKVFGFATSVYKATSSMDGKPYILRRLEGFRLLTDVAMSTVESWRRIKHSGIVSVREAFTTKAFGDNSLVFVYDYFPLATTLSREYLTVSANRPPTRLGVPEKSLWSFILQIGSAIKVLHAAGLAARILEPSKILVTGKNRVRLNCCGIFDMINYDGGKNVLQFQQDDLVNFGRLIIALACGSVAAVHNLPKSLDFLSRQFNPDLKNIVLLLLSKRSTFKTIDDVLALLMPRMLAEMNSAFSHHDVLEAELAKETENGRVVRCLCKLGFINERPEFDMDPAWSETGDRYLLKLFRDYVFHQVDEHGNPVVDIGHVLQCLNKLDAGVDERILLMSRDEQSCLIVSYKDLKRCIEESFGLLSRAVA